MGASRPEVDPVATTLSEWQAAAPVRCLNRGLVPVVLDSGSIVASSSTKINDSPIRPVSGLNIKLAEAVQCVGLAGAFGNSALVGDSPLAVGLNETDSDGYTPLTRAVYFNQPEVVKELIQSGADVDQADDSSWTPLIAAVDQDCPEIITILLDAGADIDKTDDRQWTSLSTAVFLGREECVDLLVARGADVNKPHNGGWSPLNSACDLKFYGIAHVLVKNKANVKVFSDRGVSPLLSACRDGQMDMVRSLIESGAPVDQVNIYSNTPFLTAVNNGHLEIASWLLENCRLDIDRHTSEGYSALMLALEHGYFDFAELLIQKGATNTHDRMLNSPLTVAVGRGDETICRSIINGDSKNAQFIDYLTWRDEEYRRSSTLFCIRETFGKEFIHFLTPSEFYSLKNTCRMAIQKHMKCKMYETDQLDQLPDKLKHYVWRIPVNVKNAYEWDLINKVSFEDDGMVVEDNIDQDTSEPFQGERVEYWTVGEEAADRAE